MRTRLSRLAVSFALTLLLMLLPTARIEAKTASSIEVRFCPSAGVRTYPLENRRELNSLMVQNVAILNHGTAPFKVVAVDIELLKSGEVLEAKKLDAAAIDRAATRGAKMQAAGVIEQISFQFCGDELVPRSVKLAGPTLAQDQALLISSQVFAFNGARDLVRVRVHGTFGGRSKEFSGTIPIKSEFAKNTYIFPLRGVCYVGAAASFHTPHRWAIPEEFGLDIAKIGENGLTHRGDGTRFDDYYAYGADVLAVADGRVVAAVDDEPEDPAAMQRPDESQEAYFARLQKDQAARMAKGSDSVTGNYVLIDHGQNE
jgi:murein DD-endopeptidase MepM/ murein hydrolase activator NlpD